MLVHSVITIACVGAVVVPLSVVTLLSRVALSQALFECLLRLKTHGYDDSVKDTDSEEMRKLRTGLIVPCEVILTGDHMALMTLLYGRFPYEDYCMLFSTLMQTQLANMDLAGPTTKTGGFWAKPWNQGLDSDAAARNMVEGQITGGVGGFTADNSVSDSLHLLCIRTLNRIVTLMGEVLDSCSQAKTLDNVLDRAVSHWRNVLQIRTYRAGVDSKTLSCTVLNGKRWLRLHKLLFTEVTTDGQEVKLLPGPACEIIEMFLQQLQMVRFQVSPIALDMVCVPVWLMCCS